MDRIAIDSLPGSVAASCHADMPAYALGLCRRCYDAKRESDRPELRERRLARTRAFGHRHYEAHKDRINARYREKYGEVAIPVRREDRLRARYGMTLDDYDAMCEAQGGVCWICHRPPRGKKHGKRLYVDHDANTGKVRGLLCPGCNTAIGQFSHDPILFLRAIDYLEQGAKYDIPSQIRCVEREIALRERDYPRLVKLKAMTQTLADREIANMRAVLATLEAQPKDRPELAL